MRALRIPGLAAAAILIAGAAHANLIANGDFTTGDFTDWSLFTTSSNGTLGSGPEPYVSLFDVTGSGPQDAATFNVGALVYDGLPEGGGLTQMFVSGAGLLHVSAAIASYKNAFNGDWGTFSLIVDGSTIASHAFGPFQGPATLRAALSGSTSVSGGSHTLELLITRDFQACGDGCTPDEYVTDVSATIGTPTPEPAAWALATLGTALVGVSLRRRRALGATA